MAFNSLTAKIGDLRLVLAPGMEIPHGQGPVDATPKGDGAVVPSYECDTEDWRDKEKGGGGGGGGPSKQKQKPQPGGGGGGKPGEAGEGEGEPGEEESPEAKAQRKAAADEEYDNLAKQYAESTSKQSDDVRNKVLGKDGDPIVQGEVKKAVDRVLTDPRTRRPELHPGYKRDKKADHYTLGGFGIGRELNNTGYRPIKTGAWKEAVKRWFKSKEIEVTENKWTREEAKTMSVRHQIGAMFGGQVRLPARDVPTMRSRVSKCLVFVDVSGSVFSTGIQFDFTSIIKSVKPDEADIYIWTFDDGIRSKMMRPWNYVPMEGGGGTQPWAGIAEIVKKPEYKDADGYLMLTDGAFADPASAGYPKLIIPSKWCFLMTSEYQENAIPRGCTILETFVEDPEYIKAQEEKGRPKDIFKKAVIKK